MSDFDVRFAAYERAMHANNNFGLSGQELADQYGRYAQGLQQDEIKAANKAFGKEYGRALAQERAAKAAENAKLQNALNGSNNKLIAQHSTISTQAAQTNPARLIAQHSSIPTATSVPVRNVHQFNIAGKNYLLENGRVIGYYDKLDGSDFRNHIKKLKKEGVNIIQGEPTYPSAAKATTQTAAQTNSSRAIAQNSTLTGGAIPTPNTPVPNSAIYPTADGKEYAKMLENSKVKPTPTPAQNPIKLAGYNGAKVPAGVPENIQYGYNGSQLVSPIKPQPTPAPTPKQVQLTPQAQQALENARKAEQAGRFKGTSQDLMRRYHEIDKPDSDITKYFRELEEQQKVKPAVDKPGFFGKIGNWIKNNKKALLIGAAVVGVGALIGWGISKLKDKKAEEAAEENAVPVVPPQDETPEEQAPVAVTEPEEIEEAPEQEEAAEETSQYGNFKAVKGSWEWRFAQRELILEHLGEPDYKPSDKEIRQRAEEIAARTDRVIDETGHSVKPGSNKWLQLDEEVVLTEKMAELANEAKAQLIEEHKDQKGYEPTWKEIRKIVDEKIQELKTQAAAEAQEQAA